MFLYPHKQTRLLVLSIKVFGVTRNEKIPACLLFQAGCCPSGAVSGVPEPVVPGDATSKLYNHRYIPTVTNHSIHAYKTPIISTTKPVYHLLICSNIKGKALI